MPSRDPSTWMWTEACEMLDRAERLHRQFFRPGRASAGGPSWEPPIDVYATGAGYRIMAALPGVRPAQLEIVVADGALVVICARPSPLPPRATLRSETARTGKN